MRWRQGGGLGSGWSGTAAWISYPPKNGVPVVFFCDGEHPDYHQVGDSADRLDYMRMEAVARLAAWSVWATANGKARPQELGKQPGW